MFYFDTSFLAPLREYSQTEENEAILLFEQMINHGFFLITPSLEDFQQARLFLQNYQIRLRTGDALHLAMAFRKGASHIYTLDRGMVEAGSFLGMAILFGNITI